MWSLRRDPDGFQRRHGAGQSRVNRRSRKMTALGAPACRMTSVPMIAALLSDDNRWVNGQRIEVSGGMAL